MSRPDSVTLMEQATRTIAQLRGDLTARDAELARLRIDLAARTAADATVDRIERALTRSGKGNPYHDDKGHFAAAGTGHTGRKAQKKRKLKKLHAKLKHGAAELKARHGAERAGLAERQRNRHAKHRQHYGRRQASMTGRHERELQRLDARHAKGQEKFQREVDKSAANYEKQGSHEAAENVRKAVPARIQSDAAEKDRLKTWHAAEKQTLKQERREAAAELKDTHAKQRKGMLKRHRQERADYLDHARDTLDAHGFSKRKAAVAGPPSASTRALMERAEAVLGWAEGQMGVERSNPRPEPVVTESADDPIA